MMWLLVEAAQTCKGLMLHECMGLWAWHGLVSKFVAGWLLRYGRVYMAESRPT